MLTTLQAAFMVDYAIVNFLVIPPEFEDLVESRTSLIEFQVFKR